MNKKIYNRIILRFKSSGEYYQIVKNYSMYLYALGISLDQKEFAGLEPLLKDKNKAEMSAAYYSGMHRAKLKKDELLFEKGVDETIDFGNLYDSPVYQDLVDKIRKKKENILSSLDIDSSGLAYMLFEIYNDVNYELIKTSYLCGYEDNNGKTSNREAAIRDEENMKIIISSKLRYCRNASGMTQQVLSEKLGVDRTLISSYELGKSMPSLLYAFNFSRLFSLPMDVLVNYNITISDFQKLYPTSFFQKQVK